MDEKLTLNKFKLLTEQEKVDYINKFCNSEKQQKEIENEIGFTNLSKYISKEFANWDRSLKKYVLVQNNNLIKNDEILTKEEILFLKKFILDNKNKKEIREIETSDTITRSYRVSKTIADDFAEVCKEKGLYQTQVLNHLMNKFIEE